ncbi:MAG: hypothetical protein ACOYZ8_12840 [Chloroflexota bacterium]
MTDDTLSALRSQIQDGRITAETFNPKRSYKVLAMFGDDAGTMFMLIGEHDGAYGVFEARNQSQWSFHSGHSSLEGALDEIRGFNLKRLS